MSKKGENNNKDTSKYSDKVYSSLSSFYKEKGAMGKLPDRATFNKNISERGEEYIGKIHAALSDYYNSKGAGDKMPNQDAFVSKFNLKKKEAISSGPSGESGSSDGKSYDGNIVPLSLENAQEQKEPKRVVSEDQAYKVPLDKLKKDISYYKDFYGEDLKKGLRNKQYNQLVDIYNERSKKQYEQRVDIYNERLKEIAQERQQQIPEYLQDVKFKVLPDRNEPETVNDEAKAQKLTWENDVASEMEWGPKDFSQYSETTGGNEISTADVLPEVNPFIPTSVLDGVSDVANAASKSPSFLSGIATRSSKTAAEVGRAYNRAVANGLSANNLQHDDPKDIDFQRLAELSTISKKNQPKGVYKDFAESENTLDFFSNLASKAGEAPGDFVEFLAVLSAESLVQQASAAPSADPSMVTVGAAGGSVIPGVGTAAGGMGGALGSISYALEESAFITEQMQELGYDITEKEDVKEFFTNEQLLSRVKSKANEKGIPIGALDMLSVGIAGNLGGKTIAKKLMRELPTQMGLGGAGEALGQASAWGEIRDDKAITAEIFGEIGGSAPEITMGMLKNKPELLSTPSVQNAEDVGNITEAQKGIAEDMKKAPGWLKPELAKRKQELDRKKNELTNKQAEFYNNFSEKDQGRISEINSRLKELNQIKEGDVSDATKGLYQQEQNALVEEKIKIEEKYLEKGEQEAKQVSEDEITVEDPSQPYSFEYESESQIPSQLKNVEPVSRSNVKTSQGEKIRLTFSGQQLLDAGLAQQPKKQETDGKKEGQVEYFERDLGGGEKVTFKVEDGKRIPIDEKDIPQEATVKSEKEIGETEVAPVTTQGKDEASQDKLEEAPAQEVDKTTKNKIGSLRKKANKKARKTAAIPNASKEVRELTSLPLHRIKSKKIAEKTQEVLERANKKGNVTPEEVTSLTEEVMSHLETIEEKRKEVNTNEDVNEGLKNAEKQLESFDTNIKDKSSLQKARNKFTRLQKKLRFLETANSIVNDASELQGEDSPQKTSAKKENEEKIKNLREKLAEKAKEGQLNVEELNKQLNKESNNLVENLSARKLSENEAEKTVMQKFFNAVKNYDPEDIGLSAYMNDIINDIQSGFVNSKDISDATIEINSSRIAESKEMEQAISNINDMKSMKGKMSDFVKMLDPRPKAKGSLKAWTDRFRNKEWQMWERYLGVGDKSSFFEDVLNNVITGFDKYNDAVSDEMNAFKMALSPRFKKDGKLTLNSVFSGLSNVLGDIRGKSALIDRLSVGMVMSEESQRERNEDTNWDKVIGSEAKMSNLEAKERRLFEKVFKGLPKNEDGSINIEESYKELFKRDRNKRLHNFLKVKFEKDGLLANRQKEANAARNLPTEFEYESYFPALVLDTDNVTDEAQIQEMLSLENMRPKIASDRGKSVTDPSPKLMQIDPAIVFKNYVTQVNRDYYMNTPIRTAYRATTKLRKKAGDTQANTAFKGVRSALEASVKDSFTVSNPLFNKMMGVTHLYLLVTKVRFVAESFSETLRTTLAGPINRRMGKYAKNELYSTAKDFTEKIKGVTIDDTGKVTTTKEFRSNLKKLLDFIDSPYARQFSRQNADGNINSSEGDNIVGKSGKYIMGFPNRLTLWSLILPAFDNRFKELTGENFDFSKLDDPEYMESMNREIVKAGAYANKRTAQFKGFSSRMGGRTKNKAILWSVDALKNPKLFSSNQFLGSFGWRDSEELLQAARDINLAIAGQMSKEGKEVFTKYTASSPGEAVRNITSIIIGNLTYPISMTMMTYFAVKDDDEDDRAPWENDLVKRVDEEGFMNPESLAEETIGLGLFLVGSRYGYASRIAALVTIGEYTTWLENEKSAAKSKKEKDKISKKINKIDRNTKAYFFQDPIVSGNKNPTRETSVWDAIGLIPGTQAPVAYAEQTRKAIESAIKAHKNGNEDQEDRAYMILFYNMLKFNLMARGVAIPFGKGVDKSIVNEKLYKDLNEGAKERSSGKRERSAGRSSGAGRKRSEGR